MRQALVEDLDQRADRLAELLAEAELLRRHAALSLPADLRRHLDARAIAIGRELTELLVDWRLAGGELALELPRWVVEEEDATEDGPDVTPPAPDGEQATAEPADPTPDGTAPPEHT
ncbi:MAG: hypothetical protein D6798_02610, partial [Deltaproteobacteria bacterium]